MLGGRVVMSEAECDYDDDDGCWAGVGNGVSIPDVF